MRLPECTHLSLLLQSVDECSGTPCFKQERDDAGQCYYGYHRDNGVRNKGNKVHSGS